MNLLKAFKSAYPKRERNKMKRAFEYHIKKLRNATISDLNYNGLLLPYLRDFIDSNYLNNLCNNITFEVHCGDESAVYDLLIKEWL